MSIKDSLLKIEPYKRGCKYSTALADMDVEDREAIENAMDNRALYSSAAIAKVLRDEGFPVSENMIRLHRRKECASCNGHQRQSE